MALNVHPAKELKAAILPAYDYPWKDGLYRFENIAVLVCGHCNEAYLEEDTERLMRGYAEAKRRWNQAGLTEDTAHGLYPTACSPYKMRMISHASFQSILPRLDVNAFPATIGNRTHDNRDYNHVINTLGTLARAAREDDEKEFGSCPLCKQGIIKRRINYDGFYIPCGGSTEKIEIGVPFAFCHSCHTGFVEAQVHDYLCALLDIKYDEQEINHLVNAIKYDLRAKDLEQGKVRER